MFEITAAPDDDGRRLDRVLRKFFPSVPLSGVYTLLRKGKIRVNGKKATAGTRITAGAVLSAPDNLRSAERGDDAPRSSCSSLDIIFENSDLLVLNKPAGIPVHTDTNNLADMVRNYLKGKIPDSLSFTPGPLHRLDQPTSGLIVFSKSLSGARLFSALIRERRVVKRYLALVEGVCKGNHLWKDALVRDTTRRKTFQADCGKSQAGTALEAETLIEPLASNASYTLISAEIRTGRTHQIRFQAARHGHPLCGDVKYGGAPHPSGLLLHARSLEFPLDAELPSLYAPLPDAFTARIQSEFPLVQFSEDVV